MSARRAPARAIAVTAEHSYVDGARFRSPLFPSAANEPAPMPLPDLLDRVSRAADPRGLVLVLAADALKLLGMPDQLGAGAEHEMCVEMLRGAGWTVPDALGHWTRAWRRGSPNVNIAVPNYRGKYDPDLADGDDLAATTRAMAAYVDAVGAPYAVSPGYAAVVGLRDGTKRAIKPYWAPDAKVLDEPIRHGEPDLLWSAGAVPTEGWCHTYDAYAAHLGAAAMAEVAVNQLQRQPHGPEWDPTLAGYWLIDPPAWQHARMPSPTHGVEPVAKGKAKGRIWVCTPTMKLLHELAGELLIDPPVVHDSLVEHGSRSVLRPWAERLRDALGSLDGSPDAELLRPELKATYRQAVGWLAKPNKIVYRPDWRHAIVSQGRATMWRRAWRIGQAEDRWPLAIATDSLSYASHLEDGAAACPEGLRLGTWGLGRFRCVESDYLGADDLADELVTA